MPTFDKLDDHIAACGAVANIGQFDAAALGHLTRRTRAGEIVRYRGHFDTKSPAFGAGPLKTIFATPEFARQIGALDGDEADIGDTIEGQMLRRQWAVSGRGVA